MSDLKNNFNKKGQVTIFIIIAIVIIVGLGIFFLVRGSFQKSSIPASIEPAYNSFLTCLQDDALVGIDVLESQGGYIETPAFYPGSAYMPFSSHLDFLGTGIPYWYYVSGNNVQKEQVPEKSEMASQLGSFIEGKIRDCVFDSYIENGFVILMGEPKAKVKINDEDVDVTLGMDLIIEKGDDRAIIKDHDVNVKTKLGSLYDSAVELYDYEQEKLFLEDYAVDVMRLYAPVDGVKISCSPLVWNANEVFENLSQAISANTQALKAKDGAYELKNKVDKYFVIDKNFGNEVRFLNSPEWPSAFSVTPAEGSLLISKPVGNGPGMGIMGFCYVPYHYVYDIKYPVLAQVSSGDEIFQFPMGVVIMGNLPREAMKGSTPFNLDVPDICQYSNTLTGVNVYNTKMVPLDADISYQCASLKCDMGKASEGWLQADFPQCVNGFVLARAEGYADKKVMYSTVSSGRVDILMDRIYDIEVDLNVDGKAFDGQAIVSFISENNSATAVYPNMKKIKLLEGQYEILVYIYKNSSITLGATTNHQCIEVPSDGLAGIFGGKKEECFDYNMPAQVISNALAGGGKENYYVVESELENNNVVEINAASLPTPKTIEELQNNYILFEEKDLGITFKR